MSRFKFQKQYDSMQCGVACMVMICRHFGKDYSPTTLDRYCTPSSEGVSLKGIADLCHNIGLDCVAGRLSIDDLASNTLPCILHWNQDHFVVLYKISGKKTDKSDKRKFHIADPAKGKISYSVNEFKEKWNTIPVNGNDKGIAMFFEPYPDFFSRTIEERKARKGFGFLFKYIVKYKKKFSLIALGLLLGSIFQLVIPFLTQWIVDIGIKNEDIGFIWLILLGEFALVTGKMLSDFMRRWLLLGISTKINISLVSDFLIKLLNLPMSFFDTKLMGDLLQRIGDHGRVQSFLTNELLNILFTVLSFIVLGSVLFIYDETIFFVFFIGSVMYALWIALFLRKRKVLDYEVFEKEAKNSNLTYRFISSMQEVKLQNCKKRRLKEWENSQENLLEVRMRALKLQQTQEAGSIFINELKNILVTVIAATAVIDNKITLGAMLAVQYIIGQLNGPISQIMGFVYTIQDTKISLESINEIHDEPNETISSNLKTKYSDCNKGIGFENVDFKYDRHSSRNILSEINTYFEEGKVTAIVGTSGSGKTTMIKLMLGYYPVNNGQISLGGKNINEYDINWWRSRCGVVMQEGIIFSESIERNIAVEDGAVDKEKMLQAAKMACIHEFIQSLPLKYHTKIGPDGHTLSLGQRQRILIARAIYKNPDYIFLDEATNSLDANNERAIVENLSEFCIGKTVIIVAHRLSTVRHADKIIVLENGHIIESGNHETLIKKQGAYHNLVKNQLELGN